MKTLPALRNADKPKSNPGQFNNIDTYYFNAIMSQFQFRNQSTSSSPIPTIAVNTYPLTVLECYIYLGVSNNWCKFIGLSTMAPEKTY